MLVRHKANETNNVLLPNLITESHSLYKNFNGEWFKTRCNIWSCSLIVRGESSPENGLSLKENCGAASLGDITR